MSAASESFSNRLIHEKSPYLLQHAHNPVDWYPWGEEAFEKARSLDRPVFLSIGYATCHWCHVMEKESFENPQIAKMLNDTFVNIKVDREELPEIDSIYMEMAQALMSSSGGWPLNVILTPELKPFFAVTYMPPKSNRGMMGLEEFVPEIQKLWQSEERAALTDQAEQLVELFKSHIEPSGEETPGEEELLNSIELLFELSDPVYGGIKGVPKFPLSYHLDFLMAVGKSKNESRAVYYVELTLDKMSQGGIYDHLGGGFSRYSVDEKWIIPHFEKMLYDNAFLADSYLAGWKFTGKASYRKVCEEILNYILSEMTHKDGGFFSAEDADTEAGEGVYYTWTLKEIAEVLTPEESAFFCKYFNVTETGNFEKRNILYITHPQDTFPIDLEKAKAKLLAKRKTRPAPLKDDKILTSWNGLMINACMRAASSFKREDLKKAALTAAEFIWANLWKDTHLLHRYRDGEGRFVAGLDDYAYLIRAYLTLFEEGQGTIWFERALQMCNLLERHFKAEGGAFYQTVESETVLLRKCTFYDGAEPSGNGVHAENLLRIYQMTFEEKYLKQAEDILKAAKMYIDTYPPGASYHLIALERLLDEKKGTIVVALNEQDSLKQEISDLLGQDFAPNRIVIWKKPQDEKLATLIPIMSDKAPVSGKTVVYICRQDHCEAPLSEWEEIAKAIKQVM